MALDQVLVSDDAAKSSVEVKQYGGENQMRIITQYKFDDTSEETTAEVDALIYNALKGFYSYPITLDQFTSTQEDGIFRSKSRMRRRAFCSALPVTVQVFTTEMTVFLGAGAAAVRDSMSTAKPQSAKERAADSDSIWFSLHPKVSK